MRYYVVIPAYNEQAFIKKTLQSIVAQTLLPTRLIIVDDNSTDDTAAIVQEYANRYPWISLLRHQSDAIHLPGSKVVQAFQKGFDTLDQHYDVIIKLDADLILPPDYIESLSRHFSADPRTGMVGGFAYIQKNGNWELENLTNKDHIRGAFKAYRKACFLEIGGLRPAMGWDTVDELLCHFYGWKVVTDSSLRVKHLKPTGASYNKAARYKQGEAFYSLGYGFAITAIASLKLALKKRKPLLFIDYLNGFWRAKQRGQALLVSKEQAKFIRSYRWKKMFEKLF